jgi:hypothetical protein
MADADWTPDMALSKIEELIRRNYVVLVIFVLVFVVLCVLMFVAAWQLLNIMLFHFNISFFNRADDRERYYDKESSTLDGTDDIASFRKNMMEIQQRMVARKAYRNAIWQDLMLPEHDED